MDDLKIYIILYLSKINEFYFKEIQHLPKKESELGDNLIRFKLLSCRPTLPTDQW